MIDEIYIIKNYCDAQLLCQQALNIPLTKQVGLAAFAELRGTDPDELLAVTAKNAAELYRVPI